jgi:hypothetical protein
MWAIKAVVVIAQNDIQIKFSTPSFTTNQDSTDISLLNVYTHFWIWGMGFHCGKSSGSADAGSTPGLVLSIFMSCAKIVKYHVRHFSLPVASLPLREYHSSYSCFNAFSSWCGVLIRVWLNCRTGCFGSLSAGGNIIQLIPLNSYFNLISLRIEKVRRFMKSSCCVCIWVEGGVPYQLSNQFIDFLGIWCDSFAMWAYPPRTGNSKSCWAPNSLFQRNMFW